MIAVMAAAMVTQSAIVSVGGAALLVAVSMVCAGLSRERAWLREHVIDLWAMALALLAFLPHGAAGHHAVTVPSGVAFAVVLAAWCVGRVALVVVAGGREWRMPAASAAVTLAGLALMPALCG